MANQDISRFLLQPAKHYAAVHLQQGRVIVDSDWNERANLAAEDLRSTMLDIVCSRGTPNDGMLLSSPTAQTVTLPNASAHSTYNFTLAAGSYYLGGLRLSVETNEQFLTQSDWLQVDALAANMPEAVAIGAGDRIDLVYMLAWEQPVTAVEDRELLEPALGGRDTSTRVKRMRRFQVLPDVSSALCQDAFDDLLAVFTAADFDAETGELASKGRLSVGFVANPDEQDLCADPTDAGYVAAQNQAIRVELRQNTLVWGFDNGSRLFRVQVVEGETTRLTLLDPPDDVTAFPLAGQVVEVLPWGALLPNLEKVAEPQGVLARVDTSYDPNSNSLVLDTAVGPDWIAWLADHSAYYNTKDPTEEQQYLYLRVWDRGGVPGTFNEISYVLGTPVVLGNTGLSVTVSAHGMPGDYWIIAARPSTPELVTPWDLGDASNPVPPHGPRRFCTPLATISWTDNNPLAATASVTDCRAKITPLCAVGGCCTVTVGDGKRSFGQVNTLQDAIDVIASGGKICLLPGVHEGNALLDIKSDIIIEGCGPETVLKNPLPETGSSDFKTFLTPVLHIRECSNIVVRDLAIEGYSAVGVQIERGSTICSQVRLERLQIHSTGAMAIVQPAGDSTFDLPAPGIHLIDAREIDIVECTVSCVDLLSFSFGVILSGEHLRMRDCEVLAPTTDMSLSNGLWGVHVRSTSRDVDIVGCTIDGGWGYGIALGHGDFFDDTAGTLTASTVRAQSPSTGMSYTSVGPSPDDCDCGPGRRPTPPDYEAPAGKIFLPAGPVEDLRIHDNHILNHGFSGISTTLFFPHQFPYPDSSSEAARFIVVTDVDIARNLIEQNLRLELPADGFIRYDVAVGGIVLAASVNAWIHDNVIRSNGERQVQMPSCGIGLIAAMNAVIEDNQISDTGLKGAAGQVYRHGLRGGIAIGEATTVRTTAKQASTTEFKPTFLVGTDNVTPPEPVKDWADAPEGSAVIVRGNEVVHPLGRALWVRRAFGAVTVTGNTLVSYGNPVPGDGPINVELGWRIAITSAVPTAIRRSAGGACVEINNLGLAFDIDWSSMTLTFPAVEMADPGADQLLGGQVLFSANATRLEWTIPGGWASAVCLSSLDSASMTGNTCHAIMSSTFGTTAGDPAHAFLLGLAGSAQGESFLIAHAYVGGRSGSLMSGNQFSEGQFDALFSGVTATPLAAFAESLSGTVAALCSVANVGSHLSVGSKSESTNDAIANNVGVHVPTTLPFSVLSNYDVLADASNPQGLLVEVIVTS